MLSHYDESTFFDKKIEIDLKSENGKSKLLKHIAALSNSNPSSNSFLIVGVDNNASEIRGIDFIDDSDIQNIVNSCLYNPPILKYENVFFPDLKKDKAIGLLTIYPSSQRTGFSKNLGKITLGSEFYRRGSTSVPMDDKFYIDYTNIDIVKSLENQSKISYKQLLDDVFDFYETWSDNYNPTYLVFREQFVLCYGGYPTTFDNKNYLSEVDIRIINEGTRFFYSATQWVRIIHTENSFTVTEYVSLGFNGIYKLYPFEQKTWDFLDNGKYIISSKMVLVPPEFPLKDIHMLYSKTKELEEKYRNGYRIESIKDFNDFDGLAINFLVCYFNGINESREDLIRSTEYLDGAGAESQAECMRILNRFENGF